jgi:hypothetical protein
VHQFLPSTTLCCKACQKKFFQVLLCATKLAQSMSQQYLEARSTSQSFVVLQACTKNLPVQDRATKFSHSFSSAASSQKDWRKEFPSTSSCCKICTKWPQYYLSTAKLRRSGCQYNFVLHSLQKVLTSTSSCYFCHKARTNYFLAPLLYKACTNNSSITSYKTSCMM